MNTIARLILVALLACGPGCAHDRVQHEALAEGGTLVTVDVTGTWRSTAGGSLKFELEQHGSRVTGSMRLTGLPGVSNLSGPVDGTVSGDTFRFIGPSVTGEFTASEDEMIGEVRGFGQAAHGGRVGYNLRRSSN